MLSKSVPVVQQDEAADCGFACITMLCKYHGLSTALAELKATYGASIQGTSLYELHEVMTDIGFTVRGIQFELDGMDEISLPAIVHWSGHHFIVLEAIIKDTVTLVDPAFGRTTMSIEQAAKYLTGFALEIVSAPSEAVIKSETKAERGPSVFALIRTNRQIWPMIAMVGLGATLYQVLSLTMPYLVSLVIDKAVMPRDTNMLVLIMYVFSGFFLAKIGALFINSRLQANLHYSLNLSLFSVMTRHLLSLSYSFFLRRSAADLHARLRTLESVRSFFASGVFEVPFSILYTVAAVAILFYLEPMTAMVAALFILGTVVLEIPAQLYLESHQKKQIQAEIEESKAFVSSMLRIDHIKLNSSESMELADIIERQRERIYADRGLEVAQRDISSIVEAVRLIEKLALVYLLATQAIAGNISIGLAVAFLMFSDEIKQRLLTIVQVWSTYRATRVQLKRLHEISIEPPEFEPGASIKISDVDIYNVPHIQLNNVGFSYQRFGDPVLQDVSIAIEPGDKIVLFGPSGSGKSTLLRILSTLLQPTSGSMTIDGLTCEGPEKARLRRMTGGLFAEDRLMEGTILTNLVRDTPVWKEKELERVLDITGLDKAIQSLESGIHTLIVGDGRGVSSGQSQRILLARALLKAPKMLLLDEPTSHCDGDSTQNIIRHLAEYDGTVIVCTHDPEFLNSFNKVIGIREGRAKWVQTGENTAAPSN